MDWTPEAIEALRGYWAEGHSTAEIGRRMGISKNAVVGKAHRLVLPPRPSPIRREPASGTAPAAAVAPVAQPAPQPASPATATPPAPRPQPAPAPQPVAAQPPPAPRPAPAPVAPRPAPPPVAAAPARKPAPPPPARAMPAVVRPFPRSTSRSCCWPIGEPGTPGFRFCTAEAMGTKPYCAEHAAIAYVKVRDRREDAA